MTFSHTNANTFKLNAAALAIAAAFTLGITPANAQSVSDAAQVEAANQAFYDAFSGRSLRVMEDVWARGPSVRLIRSGGRGIVTGWDAVQAHWKRVFERFTQLTVRMEEQSVQVGPRFAYVVGKENLRGLQGRVDSEVILTVMATNVFEKREGRWLLVNHHATTVTRF
jgi:ketosteroid isomerase-like protein